MEGQRAVGEAVVAGLALDETSMDDLDFTRAASYVMSPPIRSVEHQRALRSAVAGGVLHLIGTDHAVFNSTQKAAGVGDFRKIPNGVNGLEERLHVVWHTMVNTGQISLESFVRVTSTEAAKLFNVYPRKGAILPGSDADVIVFDPFAEHTISAATHHSASDTNVYNGWRIMGKVLTTISRGRIAWHDGKILVASGSSRFVATPPGGSLFNGGVIAGSEPHSAPTKSASPGSDEL